MVKDIGADTIDLKNKVIIEVCTNSFRSVRGRSLLLVIFDEVAFWRDETSANPDMAMHGAVTPGLARVPDSMLILISSTHKKSGLLYERWKTYYGRDDDAVLVVRGSTQLFNPLCNQSEIDRAIASDPTFYRAEYYSEWRDDLTNFITRELIEAAVDRGVLVRPPVHGVTYFAFADPAHGRGDSFTCAIAHHEGEKTVLDLVYERQGHFNPNEVVDEIARILKSYRVTTVTGDNAGAEWVVSAFAKWGIRYVKSELNRSEIYLNCLPLFTAGRARLIDLSKIVSQFCALERRAFPTGREVIDHGRAGHDDVCNSVAGCLVLAASRPTPFIVTPEILQWARTPGGRHRPRLGEPSQQMKAFF